MKFDRNTKILLEKNLMENTRELMNTFSIDNEFDAIIIATLMTRYTEENIFNLFSDTIELNDIPKFGINEITRLVKKHMAYKTAINHTQKLVIEGYLIDINELIIEKLAEILPTPNKNEINDIIASTFVSEELKKLAEKYEKTKRMLIINWEKLLKTSTS